MAGIAAATGTKQRDGLSGVTGAGFRTLPLEIRFPFPVSRFPVLCVPCGSIRTLIIKSQDSPVACAPYTRFDTAPAAAAREPGGQ